MLTGLQQINGHGYYLNDQHDGIYSAMKNGWQQINGRWYGFSGPNDGAAYTGWHLINGHWYYFNQDGQAETSWQTINGQRYYLNLTTGQMATGPTEINGNGYYFDPSSGHQLKGFVLNAAAKQLSYYDENTGILPSPIIVNGKNIRIDSTTGIIDNSELTDGLNQIGGSYFLFNNGTFTRNSWQKLNGAWYYFGSNGVAQTGWYKSGAGFWYYFNQSGQAETGWQWINGTGSTQ